MNEPGFALTLLIHVLTSTVLVVGAASFSVLGRFSGRALTQQLARAWWCASSAAIFQGVMLLVAGVGRPVWEGLFFSTSIASVFVLVVFLPGVEAGLRFVDNERESSRASVVLPALFGFAVGMTVWRANFMELELAIRMLVLGAMVVLLVGSLRIEGLSHVSRRALRFLQAGLLLQASRPLFLLFISSTMIGAPSTDNVENIVLVLGSVALSVGLLATHFWAVLIVERQGEVARFEGELQREFGAARRQRGEALAALARGLASDISAAMIEVSAHAAHARRDPQLQYEAEVLELAAEQGATLLQRLTEDRTTGNTNSPIIDVATVLRTALPVLKRLSPQHLLRLDIDRGSHTALCPPADLERAITNLVLNARDASPAGASILIRASSTSLVAASEIHGRRFAEGAYVVVQVTDVGTGIAPALLVRMFDPYVTTKGTQGTGLGLTSIRTFLRSIGGDITCSSGIGEGAQFQMWIPAHASAAPARDTYAEFGAPQ